MKTPKPKKIINPEIVRYKLTTRNKDGTQNKHGNIKLIGLDSSNNEYYLKYVTQEFAFELLDYAILDDSEVIDDMTFPTGENHWVGQENE